MMGRGVKDSTSVEFYGQIHSWREFSEHRQVGCYIEKMVERVSDASVRQEVTTDTEGRHQAPGTSLGVQMAGT